MPELDEKDSTIPAKGSSFRTTLWTEVVLAGHTDSPGLAAALESLCRAYWYPLYAFVRRQGHDADDAQDLLRPFSLIC